MRITGGIAKPDGRLRRVEPFDRDVARLEVNLAAVSDSRCDQVFDHFVLAIHHDRFSGQFGEVDVVALPAEAQVNAAVDEALAHHAFA